MSRLPNIRERPVKLEPEVFFVVPYTPPSVNMYVRHTRTGRHYRTKEADTFMEAVWVFSARRKVRAKEYELEVTVYFGKGQKGDLDNLAKVICDGLVEAGVIHSDAAIKRLVMNLKRDAFNPRTEITARAM